jgi:hypothetical protein
MAMVDCSSTVDVSTCLVGLVGAVQMPSVTSQIATGKSICNSLKMNPIQHPQDDDDKKRV